MREGLPKSDVTELDVVELIITITLVLVGCISVRVSYLLLYYDSKTNT
jgi:hypothetical protein